MANLTILRTYAQKDPASLPSSILFSHTDISLTIYDAYPKSMFHFLVLPRMVAPFNEANDLDSLKTLLKSDKARAKQVISSLNDDAITLRKEIEDEMVKRYGFKWGIWTGFHATPSMHHLHLHVLSADMCAEKMRNKKHYNSFHPEIGFFLDVDEVLSWFDAEDSQYSTMVKLDSKSHEKLLKEDLTCFHCGSGMKNMPTLKAHLQEEWDKQAAREKAKLERKRKFEEKHVALEDSNQDPHKKHKSDAE
ncbi:HIT-like domain-containing protein [Lyophyllum atratum]|nr:HIT-like domain-containing protein [Lyophyllum atratum]